MAWQMSNKGRAVQVVKIRTLAGVSGVRWLVSSAILGLITFMLATAACSNGDGITWSRVPDDGAVLGGEGAQNMASVTAGGPGLVAVGVDGFRVGADGAVWVGTKED